MNINLNEVHLEHYKHRALRVRLTSPDSFGDELNKVMVPTSSFGEPKESISIYMQIFTFTIFYILEKEALWTGVWSHRGMAFHG